jgi:sulfur-oxidizing protein SoxY
MNRRAFLTQAASLPLAVTALPLGATPAAHDAAIKAFVGAASAQVGRVAIEIASLVENGNTVPITVRVESPMTEADHVKRIAIFCTQNPLPEIATFHLGPANGRALVATRIRLASTQPVTAIAQMSDGTFWQAQVNVIVTLAACIEGAL